MFVCFFLFLFDSLRFIQMKFIFSDMVNHFFFINAKPNDSYYFLFTCCFTISTSSECMNKLFLSVYFLPLFPWCITNNTYYITVLFFAPCVCVCVCVFIFFSFTPILYRKEKLRNCLLYETMNRIWKINYEFIINRNNLSLIVMMNFFHYVTIH